MAHIEWTLLCEHAFLDLHGRLCLNGLIVRLPVLQLPQPLDEVTLVGRLVDLGSIDQLKLFVTIVTPRGTAATPNSADVVRLEVLGEFVFARLWGLPLREEGVHRFQLGIEGQVPVGLDVPVIALPAPAGVGLH